MHCAVLAIAGLLAIASPKAGLAQAASTVPLSATASAPLVPPNGMTLQEYQGLACLTMASITAAGVYVYSDIILEVLTGTTTNPVLLIPVIATGFAAGCSVGSTMSPAFLWIANQFR